MSAMFQKWLAKQKYAFFLYKQKSKYKQIPKERKKTKNNK